MSKDYVMQLEATIKNLRRDNQLLKEELSKYKAIENSNPSKVLECLQSVELTLKENRFLNEGSWLIDNIDTIKQALIKMQNNEYKVAFDLINKKRVDIKLVHWAYPNCKAYNVAVREKKETWRREELTEEEFEFIGRLAGAR